jgi:hypothetical protein
VEGTAEEGASHGETRFGRRLGIAASLLLGASIIAAAVGVLGEPAPPGGENEVQELGGGTGWAALVIAFAVVFLGWPLTGVRIFRLMPRLLRHRIEIHNWISIGALGLALFHGIELMALGDFRGWLSGWIATLLIVFLFVHGWWKNYWVGLWGLRMWRLIHWEAALGVLALSLEHFWLIEKGKELAGN